MIKWDPAGPVVAELNRSAEGLKAIDYATAEASRSGAELVLSASYAVTASAQLVSLVPGDRAPVVELPPGLRSAVERVRQAVGSSAVVSLVTGEGPRLKVLPKAAYSARLVVVGQGIVRGPQRLASAQGTLTLVSRISCPTVVVPATWEPSVSSTGVVVGVDGRAVSVEALDFAYRTAAERRVPLTVVHSAAATRRTGGDGTALLRAERILSELLAGRRDRYPEVDVRRRASGEPAVSVLLGESENAELLVLGAEASALAAFNPVARRIVADSKCPVAILPHAVGPAERDLARREVRPGSDVIPPTY